MKMWVSNMKFFAYPGFYLKRKNSYLPKTAESFTTAAGAHSGVDYVENYMIYGALNKIH